VNFTAFSYIALESTQTLLHYMQSFGLTGDSSNDGTDLWTNSFSGDIAYVSSPVAQIDYFTRYARVRIIDGDGSPDVNDWSIFNFGVANGNGDYDGNSHRESFFGGESVYSGGNGGDSSIYVGGVWGFSHKGGWTLLYLLNLGDSAANHRDGMWFNAGTNLTIGKRDAYDTLPVSFIGFSVHDTNNKTDLNFIGKSFPVWANEATCDHSGRYSNLSDAAAVFLSRDQMHCSLGLTWKQLLVLKQKKETRERISTGGLGKRLVNEIKVWVCDRFGFVHELCSCLQMGGLVYLTNPMYAIKYTYVRMFLYSS